MSQLRARAGPLTGVRAYYTPEKLTKTPKIRWSGGGAENAGVENAGVEKAGAITYGKSSEKKTLKILVVTDRRNVAMRG